MKKVAFVINNLGTGGVQKSLVNLLKEIESNYEVTLITFFAKKEEIEAIPKQVKIVVLKSPFKHLGMSRSDVSGKPFSYIARAFWYILTKAFGRSFVIKLMGCFQRKIGTFDTAISYLHEGPQQNMYGGCNEFVLNKTVAVKKISWLHCDFGLCGANTQKSKRIYSSFDKIVACSEGCRVSFVKCLPDLADATSVVENCNDYRVIREMAGDGVTYPPESFNIVSVARLSEEKGLDRAINAIGDCCERGYDIRYHIVGSGDQETKLMDLVNKKGLDDRVYFYGNKANPYPYIKNANLFLCTSYHEAAPMVFDESACLGVPILATETTSTDEKLVATGYGFVCKNNDDDISRALLEILGFSDCLDAIKERLRDGAFTNEKALSALKKVLE